MHRRRESTEQLWHREAAVVNFRICSAEFVGVCAHDAEARAQTTSKRSPGQTPGMLVMLKSLQLVATFQTSCQAHSFVLAGCFKEDKRV